ncbi:hypothetical protein Y032_0222g2605 [Ancylostoma ceylanicum]|uniref:Uncharacterized protein n=1 Tax=Ancylostoma ceylanicum TaxID=53326 RepID=A0A016SIN3_9BILA|nr:hypothetical protein Y032_0222g2605 [Ancylostoma ceylanicum]
MKKANVYVFCEYVTGILLVALSHSRQCAQPVEHAWCDAWDRVLNRWYTNKRSSDLSTRWAEQISPRTFFNVWVKLTSKNTIFIKINTLTCYLACR